MGTRARSPALSWLLCCGVCGGAAAALSLAALAYLGPCASDDTLPGLFLYPGMALIDTFDLRGFYALAALLCVNGIVYGFTLGTPCWLLKRLRGAA